MTNFSYELFYKSQKTILFFIILLLLMLLVSCNNTKNEEIITNQSLIPLKKEVSKVNKIIKPESKPSNISENTKIKIEEVQINEKVKSNRSELTSDDIVGEIIAQKNLDKDNIKDQIRPFAENQNRNTNNNLIVNEALDAALNLLKKGQIKQADNPAKYNFKKKDINTYRIGLILPFTGEYKKIGQNISNGVEMSFFQNKDNDVEILYFDSAGGLSAENAALEAAKAEVDIVIGPFFSLSTRIVRDILMKSNIPILSLSNDQIVASKNNWVLGYLPEDQIDLLINYIVNKKKEKIAILASNENFGKRVLSYIKKKSKQMNLNLKQVTILTKETLKNEDFLNNEIKKFTNYQKVEEENEMIMPAPYDALILAGNVNFILKTAPLLSYYDLGPSRVQFLGTDVFSRKELINEPSLNGTVFTKSIVPDSKNLEEYWKLIFNEKPNIYAKMGFDIYAIISISKKRFEENDNAKQMKNINWQKYLTQKNGFKGFSGNFRLLESGKNIREYELLRINNSNLRKVTGIN